MTLSEVLAAGPGVLVSLASFKGRVRLPSDQEDWLLLVLTEPEFGFVAQLNSRPVLARLVEVLVGFHSALAYDQFDQYLDSEQGDGLPEVVKACIEIGAQRAQELAEAILALYPAALQDGNRSVAQLAITYWDATREIPERLDAYISAHLDQFEMALEESRETQQIEQLTANAPFAIGPFAEGSDVVKQYADAAEVIASMQSLMPPGRYEIFPPYTSSLPVGTMLEVRDGIEESALVAYLQVTHHHPLEPFFGPVVRVIEGWYVARPEDLTTVAARTTTRVGLLPNEISPANIALHVGVQPIPDALRDFPTFRSLYGVSPYGVPYWGIWNGGTESVAWHPEPLTPDIERLPILDEPRPLQRLIGEG